MNIMNNPAKRIFILDGLSFHAWNKQASHSVVNLIKALSITAEKISECFTNFLYYHFICYAVLRHLFAPEII